MNDYAVIGRHYSETTCIVCNGSGEVNAKPCWDCHGRGKFEEGCRGAVTQSAQYKLTFCANCGAIPAEAVSR